MQKDHSKLHQRLVKLLRPLVRLFLRTRFQLQTPDLPELPDHFLLISNHVTNYDPFLILTLTNRHMYFVATEHIFSLGLRSKIIRLLADPIPRPKGGLAAGAVMEILRRLKKGQSVGLFAEGNCSWDGRTHGFSASTGKMVRSSGAPLVTCRIRGGYFASPRWSFSDRKGPLTLTVAGVYQPEMLRAMKPDEINALIARDLEENAYETLAASGSSYTGKRLSQGIEHALIVCPCCHGFDTLQSEGDRFRCRCGLSGRFDEKGRLNLTGPNGPASGGASLPETMPEWEDLQQAWLSSLPKDSLPAAEDADMQLLLVQNHRRTPLSQGTLRCAGGVLSLGERRFPLAEITALDVRLKGTVTFTFRESEYYEIKPLDKKKTYHGRKYQLLYQNQGGPV